MHAKEAPFSFSFSDAEPYKIRLSNRITNFRKSYVIVGISSFDRM